MKRDTDLVMSIAGEQLLLRGSSQWYCWDAAMLALERGDIDRAERMALRSIAYSVGILHPDYSTAFHASGVGGEVHLVKS